MNFQKWRMLNITIASFGNIFYDMRKNNQKVSEVVRGIINVSIIYKFYINFHLTNA